MNIKQYQPKYLSECLAVFDDNVPSYFAINERQDFIDFLTETPSGYRVVLARELIVGCFGVTEVVPRQSGRISWIMTNKIGQGVGPLMINDCIDTAAKFQLNKLNIAASHLSCAFFAKYGAQALNFIEDGWGQGMHRIDMVLNLN